jgi:hypothetical protein
MIYSINELKSVNADELICDIHFNFNACINNVILPDAHILTFGHDFNQYLTTVNWPKSLRHLIFGYNFDTNIDNVIFPDALLTIKFKGLFNQNIDNVRWPLSLSKLMLGYKFDQPINTKWPELLDELHIVGHGSYLATISWPLSHLFHTLILQCNIISNVIVPESLHTLTLDEFFDINLDTITLNSSLYILHFGYRFDSLLDDIKLPQSLHTLTFDYAFNQNLNNANLPQSLMYLKLSTKFNHDITFISNLYKLNIISFGMYFSQDLTHVKFHTIDIIHDYSNSITLNSNNFPKSLRLIIYYKLDRLDIDDTLKPITYYSRPVGQFTKAARHIYQ